MSECRNQTMAAVTGILLLIVLNSSDAHARSLTRLFKDSGMEFGGWINGGATYNANNPANGYNAPLLSLIVPANFS